MKNVIFFVCDGLSYDITVDSKYRKTPMPFLNSLRQKSTNCTKMYSQAPYTEGAIMGLMYGRNPLDNGAYLFGMQEWENSTYKSFFEKGYSLFTSYFGSFTPPELMSVGNYVYSENYFSPMFSRYLQGKLAYYKDLFIKNEITNDDYIVISRLLEIHFKTMRLWRSPQALANDYSGIYRPCIEWDDPTTEKLESWKKSVALEEAKFKESKNDYIKNLFENFDSHFLIKSCDFESRPFSKDFLEQREWVSKTYDNVFKEIDKKNKRYFFKNKQFPLKNILHSFKEDFHKGTEHFYRAYQAQSPFNKSKMLDTNLNQVCTSAKAFVRSLCHWIDEKNDNKPFFSYIHCDEFHRPLSFYSHDILDRSLIKNEFEDIGTYLKGLGKNYKGNIPFDLAAQYLDGCIKELFDYLDRKGILNDTIVVITADHGSSNFGGNIRHTVTNNFFDEQYHIPFIAYGLGKKEIKSFTNIKDIPLTIMEECGVFPPKTFNGKSIFNGNNGNTFVEYLGTGVPDYFRKPVLFEFRDNNICYVISEKLFGKSKCASLIEYYDLTQDPEQLHNLVGKISEAKKNELILAYQSRKEDLKSNFITWLGVNH